MFSGVVFDKCNVSIIAAGKVRVLAYGLLVGHAFVMQAHAKDRCIEGCCSCKVVGEKDNVMDAVKFHFCVRLLPPRL